MARKKAILSATTSLIALMAAGSAQATVTQVDGTIIPAGNNLQNELNAEGEALNAILDAAELPEVFLPNTTQPVVFSNLAEGASFENSFGWYNVGDDVTTDAGRRQNLHPILGCGVPMENHAYDPANPAAHADHHHGDPARYIQNSEPAGANLISVDFGAEQTAGRYKGGFIAFYLITPEGQDTLCGDYVTRAGVFFGRIYYTQKDLNNDGDFVHHLVYNSGLDSDRFYFGFEDLFRGGDNDFEDMLIGVDGLTPPCVPTVEVCDGIDNDCDDLVDVNDPDLTGTGDACTCDNVDMTCSDGTVFGVCQTGATVCVSGVIQCESTVDPSAEVCDDLDNNCNGTIDDNPAGVGDSCDGPDADLCPEGATVCSSGVIICSDNTGPNIETCNLIDDDCDAIVDENPSDEGGACGSDVGECSAGTEVCTSGVLECVGEVLPTGELCDGLDNNCNGVTDDNPADTGQPCGATDQGECELGVLVCSMGSPQCVGQVGPLPEVCDTRDNDCDGSIDEEAIDVGAPCNAPGLCSPGTVVCTAMGPQCQGGVSGTPEICNGLDDDCNGAIDDNPSGVGDPCGGGQGVCESGLFQCINGGLECVGGLDGTTETCDGTDNDCDAIIDEGDLCSGGQCVDGQCSGPCLPGEFPCPIGQFCNQSDFCVTDPCFGITCPAGEDGALQVCVDGTCIPACADRECAGDLVCRPSDGVCVPQSCLFLPICDQGEVCLAGECAVDPCFGVSCPSEQFCRGGQCVASCADVSCESGERCRDGMCVSTGCSVDCPVGRVCDGSGSCVLDPCRDVSCELGEVCDPDTAACIPDPCTGVSCPQGQSCDFGDCYARPGSAPVRVTAAGGGCQVISNDGGSAALVLLVLGALVGMGRRRGRPVVGVGRLLGVLGLAGVVLAGGLVSCNVNPFCLSCETTGDGGFIDAPPSIDIDGGGDAAVEDCTDGVSRPEECDDRDNDCDELVDEDFNLDSDLMNCGACGISCLLTGASTGCMEGTCEFIACFPGRSDINGDTTGPFEDSDGCEYACFVSNAGVEACDNLDNDCNGSVDEGFDLTGDNNNCGVCGRVCNVFQASSTCQRGSCVFDPATDCNAGYIDLNGNPVDGCEYPCTVSNGGTESCDLVDNDCDGSVDENTDTQTDVQNCGSCGRVCDVLNAVPACMAGMCVFNPVTDCLPGFHDANGNPVDGCEYACTVNGVEICDLVDNDCNGVVDDSPSDVGSPCNVSPNGTPTGVCTSTGTLVCSIGQRVCVGAPAPTQEICDSLDNDCDGQLDEAVTRACYTGPMGTQDVGVCRGGIESCAGGVFDGICTGEVTPAASESCDNADNDCDGVFDEGMGGGPLVQSCYSGTPGTAGAGTCVAGNQTCAFGSFGTCVGEIVDQATDVCGDGLDTDCDGADDAGEGCLLLATAETRLDEGTAGDPLGTAAGAQHSFDLAMAAGGNPLGSRVYAVWSDNSLGSSDVFFRRSTDGGATWGPISNLTVFVTQASVKPQVVVGNIGGTEIVYVVYQSMANNDTRDIRFQRSLDGGASFNNPSDPLDTNQDGFHHHAAVSIDGTTLAIVWENLNTNTLARSIRSRISTNSGVSFAGERIINVGSGAAPIAGRPQVGVTSSGRFVFVWRETRTGSTSDIFAAFSDSAVSGIPLANEVRLDGDTADNRTSDFPQLVVAGSGIYVAWQDISTLPGGGSDVVFARSSNNGMSYAPERILDDPAGEVSSSFTPSIAVDPRVAGPADDRIYVAYEDRRQGTQVFVAVSSNGGATFAQAIRASSQNGNPIPGVTRNPRIAYVGSGAAVVAYTNDQGTGIERVFASSSIDGGLSWKLSHDRVNQGTGKALQPLVVPASGSGLTFGAVIGWVDFRADTGINGDPYVRRVGQ